LRRFFRWLVGLPIIFLVIGFAIANRNNVTLSFDPFTSVNPSVYLVMPLWLLFFAGIFVGLVVGWVAAWWAQGKHRKGAREARAQALKLQAELADLRKPQQAVAASQDLVPFNGGIL
jgi:uncharacterized protein YpmB